MHRWCCVFVLLACGKSSDNKPAAATSSPAPASPTPVPTGAQGMTDAELRAAPLDVCGLFSVADVTKHLGYTPTTKPKAARDITSSTGELLLRDAGCAWEQDKITALQLNVFAQRYKSADEAKQKMTTNRAPDGLELACLGDEATTANEAKLPSAPRSVVIYVRTGATNYTISASSLDPFDYPATRERLKALIDEKL